MPNERKINEVYSTPMIVTDIVNMFSMYEPYITSWVTTNGPLLMKLAGALMAGYISLGMLKDMVLGIGSKQVSPEEKARMIEDRIKELEQETKARYLKENKKIVKEVYNHMKAENLLLEFDRKEILRLIIEALSVEDIQAMANIKDTKARNKLYRKLSRKYHPDKNPDNKEQAEQDFQDLTRLNKDPSIADVLLKKAQKAQGEKKDQQGQQSQTTQGDQEPDPKVRETLAQIAKKQADKYNPLYKQLTTLLQTFKKQPEKFFEDQAFIDNLVKIAGSINEQIDPEIQKELGLQPGKTKENLQKIIAGLEKIRKELIQALSKKGEESKNRPEAEPSDEQQSQLNENKEIYTKAKALLKREKSFYDEVNTAVDSYLKDNSDENIKKILTSFRKRKRFADFKENVEKIQDLMKTVEEQRKGAQKVVNKFRAGKGLTVSGFKDDIEAIGNYTQAYEALQQAVPSEKQDTKPLPLVPAAIEKIQGNELTIQTKDGNPIATVSKEEAKSTYDIISTADKFIRIYAVLLQYLAQKAPEEVQKVLPNKELLQLTVSEPLIEPENYPLAIISSTPAQGGSKPKDKEPEKVTDDDKGVFLNGPEVAKLYAEHLQFVFDDFEENFLNVPLLNVQSQMYSELIDGIEKFRKAVDGTAVSSLQPGGAKGKPGDNVSKNEPTEKQDTSGDVQSTDESIISQIEKLLLERRELEFDDEDMSLFKTEYKQLLKLAKMLDKIVNQIKTAKDLETFGGAKLEAQARKAAQMVQDSIAKVHDVASNELKQDIEAGKTLKEQEEEKPPTPFDRGDSSTNTEKRQQRRANFEDKVAQVKKVYERVVNQLTLLNQFVERSEKEDKVDGKDFFNYLDVSEEALDSIRQFFPSQSPFGKKLPKGENPDNYVKKIRSKMKTMVRDIIDLARQLQSLTTEQPARVNEEVGAIKDVTDSENVTKMVELMLKLSAELQDIFDAPSKISKVFAQRGAKVKNLDKAAAMNEKGEQAAAEGKAEKPDLEDQEASGAEKEINTANDAITSLKSSASDLNRAKEALAELPTKGPGKQLGVLNIKEFLIGAILYLNNFSQEQIKEELEDFNLEAGEENQKLDVRETPITKMMKLTKEKIIILNRLMANDKANIIEKFFIPLMKDKYAVVLLNKRLEAIKKKDPQSFNLSYKEAQQLVAKLSPKKDKKSKDKKFGEKVKSFFREDKVEKQLERIIEQYLNTGKL